MRSAGVFHPDFFYHPRTTIGTTQLVLVRIFDPTPEASSWVPGQGVEQEPDTLVWEGRVRVQPNKDWRARAREVQFEYDAVQAVRVQIPIGKNLVGATRDPDTNRIIEYGPDPHFAKDMRIRIVDGTVKGFEMMEGDFLYVRNAIQNQNLWVYNLLCDTKTGAMDER